jgi:hypothetical protein
MGSGRAPIPEAPQQLTDLQHEPEVSSSCNTRDHTRSVDRLIEVLFNDGPNREKKTNREKGARLTVDSARSKLLCLGEVSNPLGLLLPVPLALLALPRSTSSARNGL